MSGAGERALTFINIDSNLVTQSQQKPVEQKRTDTGDLKELKERNLWTKCLTSALTGHVFNERAKIKQELRFFSF